MKNLFFTLTACTTLLFISCESDDDGDNSQVIIDNPATYTFTRNGESTVSFSGQTTRIRMGEELIGEFKAPTTSSKEKMLAMFAHVEGASDFSDVDLNASDKSIRSKTAASVDYFLSNSAEQALIRNQFEEWINNQDVEIFPNWNTVAVAGTAGQIEDGSSTRYVSGTGVEYDQLFTKSLIGALMVDQVLNNYLSSAVLDEADNVANNDAGITEDGSAYTTMEHKWDEAYGYVYGLNANAADPNADLGADSFLNKYIGRVEGDTDFAGIADEIFQAFKLGRAAIVAGDYTERDEQAATIKKKISEVIGIRAVYYLEQGKNILSQEPIAYGSAFHDLSEGYGFIYSLQFTRKPDSTEPYFTKAEVDAFLVDLMDDGANGLWDVETTTLETIATEIAAEFDFTLEQAGS